MGRHARSGAIALLPLLALALGPWLALTRAASPPPAEATGASNYFIAEVAPAPALEEAAAPAPRPQVRPGARGTPVVGGCGCRTVEVNAENFVEKAKIRTGNVSVVNTNVTYVSNEFLRNGEDKVKIRQTAVAVSGDAIAGQVIGVQADEPGCTNVLIHARNTVVDSKLRTGNATAVNRNLVLLDPGIRSGDLKIKVRQRARAHSGEAIAGQVIGASARGGPCSSVEIDAQNTVLDTKLRTGRAFTDNENQILYCAEVGCAAELLEALGDVGEVEVCSADGCERMLAAEMAGGLKTDPGDLLSGVAGTPGPDPTGSLTPLWEADDDDGPDISRRCRRWLRKDEEWRAERTPPPGCVTPSPEPVEPAEAEPPPTPTPTPTPSAAESSPESQQASGAGV